MSTSGFVGKLCFDGSVRAIYVHHDSYLSGIGRILLDNYKTTETVDKLLDLGDLSSLGEEPYSDPDMWNDNKRMNIFNYSGCLSYKDRGEEDVDATWFNSVKEYLDSAKHIWIEYCYLFKDGEWKYANCYDKLCKFLPLTEEAIERNK